MKTRNLILTALFAALTAAGALLRIPTPVSAFTLQTLFTLLAGILLGPRHGALSQAVYVALGLAGLPVFAAGGGPSYLLHPSFGFALGLIPMAAVTGWFARRPGPVLRRLAAACLAGTAALYLTGLPYMHLILTGYLRRDWSFAQTLLGGMAVFLPWDALKAAAAVLLGRRLPPSPSGARSEPRSARPDAQSDRPDPEAGSR